MAQLPPGFVLNGPAPTKKAAGLPPGFVIDGPQAPAAGDPNVFKSGPATQVPPDPTLGETAKDFAKSTGVGVGRGVASIAGLPGDAADMGTALGDFIAGKLGMSGGREKMKRALDFGRPMNSAETLEGAQSTVPGMEYKPKTTAGEYGQTIGEFAVGSLGPGGPVRKAAQVLVPALASETAGQATKGTAAEPYARFGGALIGGGVSAGGKMNTAKHLAKGAPKGAEISAVTSQMYNKLRSAGIKYDANAFGNMAMDLGNKLKGSRAKQAPLSADVLDYIKEHVGRSPDFTDFDSIRQTAGQVLLEVNASDADKKAASIIIDALDDFSTKAPFMTTGKINPQQVNPLMKEAREMARRNIISKEIEEMKRKAETYQSGYDAGLRNQFSNYLRSNKGKRLTKEEYKAFHNVSKGVSSANAVRYLGKFGLDFSKLASGASVAPTLLAGGAALNFGMLPAGMLMGAGTAARFASPRMFKGLAGRAQGVVHAGIPAQKAMGKLSQKELEALMIRRIISGELAVNAGGDRSGQPTMSSVLAP